MPSRLACAERARKNAGLLPRSAYRRARWPFNTASGQASEPLGLADPCGAMPVVPT